MAALNSQVTCLAGYPKINSLPLPLHLVVKGQMYYQIYIVVGKLASLTSGYVFRLKTYAYTSYGYTFFDNSNNIRLF